MWHAGVDNQSNEDETCQWWTVTSSEANGRGTLFKGQESLSLLHDDVTSCDTSDMAFLCIQTAQYNLQ